MVHIYCLSGPNRAYHGANDGLKIEFFIHGAQMRRIENREPYKSRYGGDASFYLVYAVWGPDRYILYRGGTIN